MLGRQMNIYIRKPVYATVIWKAQNIILKTEQVEIGDSATPPPVEIEGYNFISWDKSYNKILGNTIINAIVTIKTFVVRFIVNGNVVKTQTVEYDSSATAPDISQIKIEGHYFKEWDKNFDHIKNDTDIIAIYEIYKYTVKFYDNKTLLKSEIVPYGSSATAPVLGDSYDFDSGWDKDFSVIKSNLNVFSRKLIKNVKGAFYNGGLYIIKNNNQMYVTGQLSSCDLLPEQYDYDNIVYEPKKIQTTLTETDKISYGSTCNFLIRDDGSLYVCGKLYYKETGYDNTYIKLDTYTKVNLTNVKYALQISIYAFIILRNDNTIWLARPNVDSTFTLTKITSGIKSIEADSNFYSDDLALTDSSIIVIKNDDCLYRLDKLYSPSAVVSTKLCDNVSKFYNNRKDTMYVVKKDGTLYGMGDNSYGKLGLGHKNKVQSFTRINIPGKVKKIEMGPFMDAILLEDGTVYASGKNTYGGFGMGNYGDEYLTYTQLQLSNIKDIFVKHTNSMFVVQNDGKVLASGSNNEFGYLGTGGIQNINQFTLVPNINNPVNIFDRNNGTIVINGDGTVYIAGSRYPLFRENDINTITFERV